jgi:hypothetical protein
MGTLKQMAWICGFAAIAVGCSTGKADLGHGEQLVTPEPVRTSSKLDLLIVADGSYSMIMEAESQKKAIADLVRRVVDGLPGVTDMHVGVITSSLGDHGAMSACNEQSTAVPSPELFDDHAHLIGSQPRFAAALAAEPSALPLAPEGFVGWSRGDSVDALTASVRAMVGAVGYEGCGIEAPLEAMHRFLTDPVPPATVVKKPCGGIGNGCTTREGVDTTLVAQRSAFLRPDSAVAVVLLADEDDCSVADEGSGWAVGSKDLTLPRGSAECVTNPNSPCCYSCGDTKPAECPEDPTCATTPSLTLQEDPLNSRCFDQKRRFGVDWLYPVGRYVTALKSKMLCTSRKDLMPDASDCPDADGDGEPDIVNNPLFAGDSTQARDPSMVHVLGVVGVPRQDLVSPDTGAYPTSAALAASGTWDVILGDPAPPNAAPPVLPTDTLMVASIAPRSGLDGQGSPLAPPDAGSFANPVNGHELSDDNNQQYACLFPLPDAVDCSNLTPSGDLSCRCPVVFNDPVCQDPASGSYDQYQRYAPAYPTPRHLALLKALGESGIPASYCASNLTDASAPDFGYRAAADALAVQLVRSIPSL